ncbi:hypothetical protein K458DRAFT_430895 [Lentithecium fluviatile CBS 122367]|uniref:Ankyrin n=1 Tax=Lentithecium fluviatile CBS 122367 TaxID=1168545 RepID=A0A6G1J4M9_9PLEO|nr:hypothetical protein K458DRAFT_430895 [Lentithecium fluviatile CBS 122367]
MVYPARLRQKDILERSLPILKDALAQQREFNEAEYPSFVLETFRRALYNSIPSFFGYLLETEQSCVDLSRPCAMSGLGHSPSLLVLELLVAHGWDVNHESPRIYFTDKMLIDSPIILENYELVVWMVEHGTIVDGGDPENDRSWPTPLLETCAAYGTVQAFRYLMEKGAKLGRKTLHRATLMAAELGTDPSFIEDGPQTDADPMRHENARRQLCYAILSTSSG